MISLPAFRTLSSRPPSIGAADAAADAAADGAADPALDAAGDGADTDGAVEAPPPLVHAEAAMTAAPTSANSRVDLFMVSSKSTLEHRWDGADHGESPSSAST